MLQEWITLSRIDKFIGDLLKICQLFHPVVVLTNKKENIKSTLER